MGFLAFYLVVVSFFFCFVCLCDWKFFVGIFFIVSAPSFERVIKPRHGVNQLNILLCPSVVFMKVSLFAMLFDLCNIKSWDMRGNVNLEKKEKERKNIILRFEILPLIVPSLL